MSALRSDLSSPVRKCGMVRSVKDISAHSSTMSISSVILALLLSACSTPGIPPPPQIVNVPVPVSCLPAVLPQRPKTATDTELAALDDYKFPLAIFLDRRLLLDYTGELEAVMSACK